MVACSVGASDKKPLLRWHPTATQRGLLCTAGHAGGLLITEGIGIVEDGFPNEPGIWTQEQVETWKPFVKLGALKSVSVSFLFPVDIRGTDHHFLSTCEEHITTSIYKDRTAQSCLQTYLEKSEFAYTATSFQGRDLSTVAGKCTHKKAQHAPVLFWRHRNNSDQFKPLAENLVYKGFVKERRTLMVDSIR